jgi:hypothetical protein
MIMMRNAIKNAPWGDNDDARPDSVVEQASGTSVRSFRAIVILARSAARAAGP